LDELNASSTAVQKAFYSLILNRRLGSYELPAGSVIIAAGNRATDQSAVKPMPAALANRFVHLHLRSSVDDWLGWAATAEVHPWVIEYITLRPDQLQVDPPKTEEPFSTPRSWHALSDALLSWGAEPEDAEVAMLASGCVSPAHAAGFRAWMKTRRRAYDLEAILRGELGWPREVADRDLLHFHAVSLRARLIKELPADRRHGTARSKTLAIRSKDLLIELADISLEISQLVVAGDDERNAVLPAWFLAELTRDLPRLVAQRGS
jgi:hypothetical protein